MKWDVLTYADAPNPLGVPGARIAVLLPAAGRRAPYVEMDAAQVTATQAAAQVSYDAWLAARPTDPRPGEVRSPNGDWWLLTVDDAGNPGARRP